MQAHLNDTKLVSILANAAAARPSTPTQPRLPLTCTFCEGTGHNLEMCYAYRDFKAKAIENRRSKQQAGGRFRHVGGSTKAAQSAPEETKDLTEVTEGAVNASLVPSDALAP